MTDMTNTLVDAGAHFNDATTLLEGGLTPTTLGQYTTDVQNARADINAIITNAAGGSATIGSVTVSPDDAVLSSVSTALGQILSEAPLAVTTTDPVAASGPVAAAQNYLFGEHVNIIADINGDPTLANALVTAAEQTPGAFPGFQLLPVGNDSAAALKNIETQMPPSLADIGSVFNAVTNLELGGNVNHLPQINADLAAIETGLTNLLANPSTIATIAAAPSGVGLPSEDPATVTAHLQTVLNDIGLQIQHDNADSGPTLATETHTNMLAIIDIVQNDPALNLAAGGMGHPSSGGGFGELPPTLPVAAPPPPPPPPVTTHGNGNGNLDPHHSGNVAVDPHGNAHGVTDHFWLHG
jgi:hypothetical protein